MINLPSEIVYAICQELDEGSLPTSRLSPLWSLALTCKSMHEHAQQILWRRVKVRFDTSNVHDDDILHRLRCLVQDPHRPQFRFVRTTNITLPYYSMVSRSDFCTDVDKAVALLLQLAREVKHITLDLSLIDHPLEMLQRTFTHLFKNLDNLESLSLAGYICGSEDIPIQRNSMQSLHLEVIGNRLPFRFDNYQSLRRLRLGIDCRDEELPLPPALQFHPQLWKTLECFVLELYGWHLYARSVKDTIAASIQASVISTGGILNLA